VVELLDPRKRTIDAIWKAWVESRGEWRRPHLGASLLGRPCNRNLWYAFRWAMKPLIPGRILRLFETGNIEERRVIEDLRRAGIRVENHDARGRQWRVTFGTGHIGGSTDGAVLGLLEAPKTWHLLEIKSANDKASRGLGKRGVEEEKREHIVQMQVYMHGTGLKRAAYFSVNKNDDSYFYDRIKYDASVAKEALARADTVVSSNTPPEKISEDPSWYQCKFCDFQRICHQGETEGLVELNCRTCVHARPVENAEWRCGHYGTTLSIESQRAGCSEHKAIEGLAR
jgi:hypothetical protein